MSNFRSRIFFVLLGLGALVAVVVALSKPKQLGTIDESKVHGSVPVLVAHLINQTGELRRLDPVPLPRAYVVVRKHGERVAGGWYTGDDAQDALIHGLEDLSAKKPEAVGSADAIEICLPHSEEKAQPKAKNGVLGNGERGVKGLSLEYGENKQRVCPTEMVANNRTFSDVERRFRDKYKISGDDYAQKAKLRTFDAYQFHVRVKGASPALIPMFRGNVVIPQSYVGQKTTQKLKDDLAHWLVTQVQPDGRMVYRYFPSTGKEAKDNNMIRQFMATVALVRLGNETQDASITELARKNLKYNLDHFYQVDGEHGLIKYGDIRLGAIALAALAIVEAPFRKEFESYELALRRSTEFMLHEDGSFQTFYGSDSTANQNFYPGETQLLWSTLYDQSRDKAIMERIQRAFRYYRKWHLDEKNRNPAFIPWHTQAYVKLLLIEDQPDMREFVFEMNDWLLSMQQNEGDYPDTKGRFTDPKRPKFGGPHASSTAVYLEGLIDAYRLAVKVGDKDHQKRYRAAIERGLRSLMQIQFSDGVDMFYVSKRQRVYGGLRTTEYDNSIRVDNVQHAFMGLQRIVKTFGSEGAW